MTRVDWEYSPASSLAVAELSHGTDCRPVPYDGQPQDGLFVCRVHCGVPFASLALAHPYIESVFDKRSFLAAAANHILLAAILAIPIRRSRR